MADFCFYCGEELPDGLDRCPTCGADQLSYRRIIEEADSYYNSGLEKAKVRDLTGAITCLNDALRFHKYHTDARNLLGLCLYERGETVAALSEWVISKNLQPTDNAADHYLQQIQTAGEMARIRDMINRYNQALAYCREGNRDLARIQLKRIIAMNSRNLSAYHLLALIMIKEKEYDDAWEILKKAIVIDVGDTTTLRYQQEIRSEREKENNGKKKRHKAKVISFQDGNETVTMPTNSFRDLLDGSGTTILNILIGLILGLLVCFFLIIPTVRQNARNDAANALVDANETATTNQNSISQLQAQVKSLNDELSKYTGMSDAVTSYELLMQANASYAAGDLDQAGAQMASINRDLLSSTGQSVYDTILLAVNAKKLDTDFATATTFYNDGEYDKALENFNAVIAVDEKYRDGETLYRLGQTYEKLKQTDQAIATYQHLIELFPDTAVASRADRRMQALQKGTQAAVSDRLGTETTAAQPATENTGDQAETQAGADPAAQTEGNPEQVAQ